MDNKDLLAEVYFELTEQDLVFWEVQLQEVLK